MHRKEILETAINITTTSREEEYGTPAANLGACADLVTSFLRHKYILPPSFRITAEDIAMINVLQKTARTYSGNADDDTYIDGAAYFSIAAELKEQK